MLKTSGSSFNNVGIVRLLRGERLFTSPLVGEVESFQAVAIAPSSLDEEGWGGVTRSVAGEG